MFICVCDISYAQTYIHKSSPSVVKELQNTKHAHYALDLLVPNTNNKIINDSIIFDFTLELAGKIISSGDALIITPVYKFNSEEHRFPPIIINGKRRHSYYKREQNLASHKEYFDKLPYAVIVQNKSVQQINYKSSYSLPNGRDDGELFIEYVLNDCCDKCLLNLTKLPFSRKVIYEELVSFIPPKIEKEKIRKEYITVRIDYPVDKYNILPYFSDNSSELSKVDKVLSALSSGDKDYKLQSIYIKAYASPEATYKYNLRLSERRAYHFKKYLLDKYNLQSVPVFKTKGFGEDWLGLRELVEKSDIAYRHSILSIIDNVDIFSGREKQLMDLNGGIPYRYMLKNMFPKLRRMEMIINYSVRSFEIDEVENVLDSRPQDLSQNEIYKYARKTKNNRSLNVAVKYFPDDAVANINASSAALIEGNAALALVYLKKVWTNPEAYNNIGVYYLLKGDRINAKKYFLKAISHSVDVDKAKYNLKQLEMFKNEE